MLPSVHAIDEPEAGPLHQPEEIAEYSNGFHPSRDGSDPHRDGTHEQDHIRLPEPDRGGLSKNALGI